MKKKKIKTPKVTIQDVEKMLDNLNAAFEPLTTEINTKLNFLQKCIGEPQTNNFQKITMEDITPEKP